MINLTANLIFLKHGADLDLSFDLAISKICQYLQSIKTAKVLASRINVYTDIMHDVHANFLDVGLLLEDWFELCQPSTNSIKGDRISVSDLVPGIMSVHSHFQHSYFMSFTKVFFIILHLERAVLLPYNFSRPGPGWFTQVETKFNIWVDTIQPFRDLEIIRLSASRDNEGNYNDLGASVLDGNFSKEMDLNNRTARRLIQCSTKLFLSTDWYTVDQINVIELEDLRCRILDNNFVTSTPLPLLHLMEYLAAKFSALVQPQLQSWIDLQGNENVTRFQSALPLHIHHVLKSNMEPLEKCKEILSVGYVPLSDFSNEKIVGWRIVESVLESLNIDVGDAFNTWLASQEYFFDTKFLEEGKPYRTAFGRLNFWLFIYLPSWIFHSKSTVFKYPSKPNELSAKFHYDRNRLLEDQPLSLVEFYRQMDWTYSYSVAVNYSTYFQVLIDSTDFPGCEGVKQPVWRRPASKKYDTVTKNIFPSGCLLLFVEFLYSIERLSDFLLENSDQVYAERNKSKAEDRFFNFENIGFVPFFYWGGECHPIMEVSNTLLSFTLIGDRHYYNPGLVRFSLLLLEVGPRGQAGQWLDAGSYDRLADRMSTHPLHLTTLWLNTDKVHSTPIFVITINRALWLLDSQREWRDHMRENCGATSFQKAIAYDKRSHSKWGKIVPLFSYNGSTGEPFSDHAYNEFWTHCCLSFQRFLRARDLGAIQLVAFIPRSDEGKPFDWTKWVAKKESGTPKTITPKSDENKVYQGVYTPLSFRAKITPHGARASFVTDMSTLLSPEDIAALTAQSSAQVVKYIRSDTLHRNLQGAYNWRDAKEQLSHSSRRFPKMGHIACELESLRIEPKFLESASSVGWVTSATGPFKAALELIASDRNNIFGVADTHVCPLNFVCSKAVIDKVGYRNCPYCPLAIFSVNNIVAVSAQKTMSYDNYRTLAQEMIVRPSDWSDAEKLNDSRLLQEAGREAIGWSVIEANLWAVIQSTSLADGRGLMLGDKAAVMSSIQRFEVEHNSAEDFFDRLNNATIYPSLISNDFKIKIDRATRLLMAGDGRSHEAFLAPFGFSSAEVLASQFRNMNEINKIDIHAYVKLISMSHNEWTETVLGHYPIGDYFLDFIGVNKVEE